MEPVAPRHAAALVRFLHTPRAAMATGASDTSAVRLPNRLALAAAGRWAGPAVLAAALGALYAPVAAGMAEDWWRQENASHGFLVPLIAAYLVWDERKQAASLARPWGWGLVSVAFGLLLAPVGAYAEVEFLPQVSLLITVGGLLLYIRGPAAAKRLAFPYAFLYFMIPWPDQLVETVSFPLQLLSARFAAMVIGMTGLPIQRDGVDLHLAGYTFSVGAPCSGMKYAVALTALAALAGYLATGRAWKRWAVFAAGLPLALAGNVVRIACVVAIAGVWGAGAANGFLHGFSGLVVFGITAAGLVAIGRGLGLRFGSRGGSASETMAVEAGSSRPWPGRYVAPLVLVLLTLGAMRAAAGSRRTSAAPTPDLAVLPREVGQWQVSGQDALDDMSLSLLRPDAYLLREYVRSDGYPVALAVVFGHRKEAFHSPGFCLLGSGWSILRKSRRTLELGDGREALEVNELALQSGAARQIVLYWYESQSRRTPSLLAFQCGMLCDRLTGRSASGAMIRLSAPVEASREEAEGAAEGLLGALYPYLREAVGE